MLQFFIAAFIAAFILFYFTCAAGLTDDTPSLRGVFLEAMLSGPVLRVWQTDAEAGENIGHSSELP